MTGWLRAESRGVYHCTDRGWGAEAEWRSSLSLSLKLFHSLGAGVCCVKQSSSVPLPFSFCPLILSRSGKGVSRESRGTLQLLPGKKSSLPAECHPNGLNGGPYK